MFLDLCWYLLIFVDSWFWEIFVNVFWYLVVFVSISCSFSFLSIFYFFCWFFLYLLTNSASFGSDFVSFSHSIHIVSTWFARVGEATGRSNNDSSCFLWLCFFIVLFCSFVFASFFPYLLSIFLSNLVIIGHRFFFYVCWSFLMPLDNSLYFLLFVDIPWYSLLFLHISWASLIFVDFCWCLLIFDDICWCLLLIVDVSWSLLIFVDFRWYLLMFVDVFWYLFVFATICCSFFFLSFLFLLLILSLLANQLSFFWKRFRVVFT